MGNEPSVYYKIISYSIIWYLNPITLVVTIFTSFYLCIRAVVLIIGKKFFGKHANYSFSVLAVWLVLNLINVPLWTWLLVMQ